MVPFTDELTVGITTTQMLKRFLTKRLFCRLNSTISQNDSIVYFDNQATSALDPRVLDEMMPFLTWNYGNPHSRTHKFGWEAEKAVEKAREQVASLINAKDKRDIIFTSGATEANNIAIKGVSRFYRHNRAGLITSQIEHKCVLDSCRSMEQEGSNVTYLPVDENGIINMDALKSNIDANVSLVSIMYVNNEIGVIQPIHEIGKLCKQYDIFFHSDAAQAIGKLDIDVESSKIDLLSISGHKLYGPKGIGALYARRRPRVRIDPIFSGGGQERGIRSGTVPPFLAVGLGAACEIARNELKYDTIYIRSMSDRLLSGITKSLDHIIINGSISHRYPGCLNISFSCVEGESLLMALKQFALSSGSACTSASLEPSYVLRAIGINEDLAHSSIRFGIGRYTTKEEIDNLVEHVVREVKRLRELSPLWEMVCEGIDLKTIQWSSV
ncbi:hypothetical protein GJ496_005772 [Pomphorhynchus laevis]|nr:hypothetical protein GJ496_005772 [Pomphorhynchus laevis]